MGGARGLSPNVLTGEVLLNLDTEEWGQFYLGCAGGADVNVAGPGVAEAAPASNRGVRIDVRGLRGGHSGVDIHEGRGHAIKALVRVLQQLARCVPFRLARLSGGTARNALPREAFAELILPEADAAKLDALLAEWQATLRQELADVDAGITLAWAPAEVLTVMAAEDQQRWLAALHAAPQGPRRMSLAVPGVVETSVNLGIVSLAPTGGECCFMVRSLVDSATTDLADEIVSLFSLAGLSTEVSGQYPGWRPNPDSPALAVCQSVFSRMFGEDSTTQVIHAGLECGIIGGKYPAMDMVSFGPTIRGAHAPGEAVEVASVERCWRLLIGILDALRTPVAA
jgi:dipeptidase D